MKRPLIVILIVLGFAAMAMAGGRASAVTRGTGVELPKGSPIPVVIEGVGSAEKKMGLTEDYIRTKVELQLRRNGLKPKARGGEDYYLYVNILVAGQAFSWGVIFSRAATYEVKGVVYRNDMGAFRQGGAGLHGEDSGQIMKKVLDGVDIISNEILKSFK